jgi:hypothetical protein
MFNKNVLNLTKTCRCNFYSSSKKIFTLKLYTKTINVQYKILKMTSNSNKTNKKKIHTKHNNSKITSTHNLTIQKQH